MTIIILNPKKRVILINFPKNFSKYRIYLKNKLFQKKSQIDKKVYKIFKINLLFKSKYKITIKKMKKKKIFLKVSFPRKFQIK